MKQIVPHTYAIAVLFFLPGCCLFTPARYFMRKNVYSYVEQPLKICNQHTITVWLHGTRLFSHPLFTRHIQYQPGLTLATEVEGKLQTIAQTLIAADSNRFTPNNMYFFCWSGKLCFQARDQAAEHLYESLVQLTYSYQNDYGVTPSIRLIGFSHGGNVALNLAKYATDKELNIQELILMACPVQENTKPYAQSPLFKKIYVLYSALDLVQILDPQGAYRYKGKRRPLFSKRRFLHRPGLAQIKIKWNRRAITHSEFCRSPFLQHLPRILDEIDTWDQNIVYKEDPNKVRRVLCIYTKPHKKGPVKPGNGQLQLDT